MLPNKDPVARSQFSTPPQPKSPQYAPASANNTGITPFSQGATPDMTSKPTRTGRYTVFGNARRFPGLKSGA